MRPRRRPPGGRMSAEHHHDGEEAQHGWLRLGGAPCEGFGAAPALSPTPEPLGCPDAVGVGLGAHDDGMRAAWSPRAVVSDHDERTSPGRGIRTIPTPGRGLRPTRPGEVRTVESATGTRCTTGAAMGLEEMQQAKPGVDPRAWSARVVVPTRFVLPCRHVRGLRRQRPRAARVLIVPKRSGTTTSDDDGPGTSIGPRPASTA
jgi:hypothetical protein